MPKLKLNYLMPVAFVGLAWAPASAADMAAPPSIKAPVLATVYDWSGFYLGVNAGIGIARDRVQNDFLGNGNPVSFYTQPSGGFGGGQAGYNWQVGTVLGPLVFGVEADIQGRSARDDRTVFSEAGLVTSYSQQLDWFGTARGRVGFAKGPVLGYFTAGYAFANVKTDVTQSALGLTTNFATDRMQGGWVIGSGVEAALGGNWTGKIEHLYLNLGNKTDAAALFAPTTMNTEIREHVFRVGLNYRVGATSSYAPVVASNRAGFYLGGNFGSGHGKDRASLSLPAVAAFETFNLAPDGRNGGVQAGYNWQAANVLFGLETDIQGTFQRDNKTCVLQCLTNGIRAAYDATLPWFGTVRGRVGYSVGPALFYATGGLAYGSVKTKITTNSLVGQVTQSLEHTKTGWTAGGGIETPFNLMGLLGPSWTTRAEYLYVDLGTTSDSFITGAAATTATRSSTTHVFRTGINYNFNSPVVAKY